MKLQKRKEDLTKKQAQLENAKIALKQEYFGIDIIIDRLIENMSSWYLFPEFQKTPHIINLWGMTGTGKTSLIRRLTELLDINDSLYSFELGENSPFRISDSVEALHDNNSTKPIILLFDEFQFIEPLKAKEGFHKNSMAQSVWKLMDTGKIESFRIHGFDNNDVRKIRKLTKAIELGVVVENGEVIKNKKLFIQIMNLDLQDDDNYIVNDPAYMKKRHYPVKYRKRAKEKESKKKRLRFVSYDLIDHIVGIIDKPHLSLADLEIQLLQLNGNETLNYFKEVVKETEKPTVIDCSKALIFVCGNLDEAFPMSRYLSPDIDADMVYEESLNVNIGDIKQCLGNFLRKEQISRLGNIHLIYPALSKSAYQSIIKYHLVQFKTEVQEEFNVDLEFTEAIHELIYQEGVYPTQGTRPLLSTIKQFIYNKWSAVVAAIFINVWNNVNGIHWNFKANQFNITYKNGKEIVGTFEFEIDLPLKELRESEEEENQIIVAVHEAGHAIAYRVLENESPKLILASSASNDFSGAVFTNEDKLYSRSSCIKKMAVLVAGFCAEKLIFGTESITVGASADLRRAESLAKHMVLAWGFQKFETSRVYQESFIRKRESEVDISHFMDEAFTIASDIMKKYEKTLINLSYTLMQKKCMYQKEIEELFIALNPTLTVAENAKKYSEIYSMQFQKKLNEIKVG